MKRVFLLRHGKAEAQTMEIMDPDRKLVAQGVEQVRRIAKFLRKKGYQPQRIISSPARRAHETALLLAQAIDYPQALIQSQVLLYSGEEHDLLTLIQNLPDELETVMLVGHNPVFETAANRAVGGGDNHLATGSVAILDFEIAHWRQAVLRTAHFAGIFAGKPKEAADGMVFAVALALEKALEQQGLSLDLAKRQIVARQAARLVNKLRR